MSEGKRNRGGAVGGGAFYGLGLIGSLVYFIQSAHSFWDGVYGVFQSLVWPAYFAYGIFHHLKM